MNSIINELYRMTTIDNDNLYYEKHGFIIIDFRYMQIAHNI